MEEQERERQPADLKDVLAVAPLLHLIPKQDFAPFVTSSELMVDSYPKLHHHHDSFEAYIVDNEEHLLSELVSEFVSFLDEDTNSVEFQRRDPSSHHRPIPPLPPLERRIYESNISFKNVLDHNHSLQSNVVSNLKMSRLSIRKTYDVNDDQKTIQHNHNYVRKFQRETFISHGISSSNRSPLNIDDKEFMGESRKRTGSHLEWIDPTHKRKQEPSSTPIWDASYNEVHSVLQDITSDSPHGDDFMNLTRLHDLIVQFNNHHNHGLEVSDLSRIERCCHTVLSQDISSCFNELLSIVEVETNPEVQHEWSKVNLIAKDIVKGFLASRIIMLILNGSEVDKSLFLEEYLSLTVSFVSETINNLVVPLLTKSTLSPSVSKSLKPFISTVLGEINHLLNEFSVHIMKYDIDEGLITKLEYLSLLLLFTDDYGKDGDVLIVKYQFDALKLDAVKVLVSIFQRYSEQREFILQEVLEGLDKHSDSNQKLASKFRLPSGTNVNIASLLLIKLIQSNQSSTTTEDYNPNGTDTDDSFNNSCNVAKSIATYLIGNLLKSQLTKYKSTTQQLVEDTLCVLFVPQLAGSTLLLSALVSSMVTIYQKYDNSNAENFIIEMLGVIAEKVGPLKYAHNTISKLGVFSDKDEVKAYQVQCESILDYAVDQKRMDNSVPIGFLREKLVNYLSSILNSITDSSEDVSTKKEQFEHAIKSLRLSPEFERDSDFDEARSQIDGPSTYMGIILAYDLNGIYDNIIELLMKYLEGQRIKTKNRSIRVLSTLIDGDPELLIIPKVQLAISSRLRDSSALVRDAVIDLISKYMNSKSEHVEQFYIPICECMNDTSISVRKRVLRLAKDMYMKLTSVTAKVYIANKLLRRLSDEEESLQDTAQSFLQQLWLMNIEDTNDSMLLLNVKIKECCEVMSCIVMSGHKNLSHFETFLAKLFSSTAIKEPRKGILVIVKYLLNIVAEGTVKHQFHDIQSSLKLVATLIAFDSSLVDQDQLISLQHFLVDDSVEGDLNRMNTLIILRRVIPSIKTFRPALLDTVKTYLLKYLTKFNVKELSEAMPIVWILCEANGDSSKLANASTSCMKHIKPYVDSKKQCVELKPDGKLIKLLHLLGNFGKYCNFEKFRSQFLRSGLGLREKESISSLMMKFLLYFSKPDTDDLTRNVAVINIINLCISHPRLFLSDPVLQVFDKEFKSRNIGIIHSIIQGFCEFIKIDESNKQNFGQVKKSSEEISKISALHGVAPMSFSDGVCSGLIQRYMDIILELCLQDEGKISFLPIQFLQLVLKQGFANIRMCTPTVIALMASQSLHIKNIAVEILKEINEKHESLVQSSVFEGINKAILQRSRLDSKYYKQNSFIPMLYSNTNRNHSNRKKFIACLSRHLSINTQGSDREAINQRDKISYMCFNIAETNFLTFEEPVVLVRTIDEIMIREGTDLKSSIELIGDGAVPLGSTLLSQALLAMLSLRDFLMSKYLLSDEMIESSDSHSLKQNLKASSCVAFNISHIDSIIEDPVEQSIIVSTFLQRIATFM